MTSIAPPEPERPTPRVPPAMTPTTLNSSKAANGANAQTHTKILSRRSSKPILHWLQRKLGTSSKFRKPHEGNGSAQTPSSRPKSRTVSTPLPPPVPQVNPSQLSDSWRKTISLNEDEDDGHSSRPVTARTDGMTTDDSSSLARESTWAPTNASADEDASMRPLPPSSPPSPSPSRSSSSRLSDPKTFKSIAASTKPTTVLSIDINAGGMAHIAQAPSLLQAPDNRTGSILTNGGGGSINFSNLPPSTPTLITTPANAELVHAPQHTAHHPRNNPRPSSPPMDNASTFTLASSAYAMPIARTGGGHAAHPSQSASAIGGGGGDSLSFSHAGSTFADAESSNFLTGDDDRDVDASVRALRPRSSRRGSWESEISRWSARPGSGTPISKTMWMGGSIKTGGWSNADGGPNDDDTGSRSSHEDTVEDGVVVTVAGKVDSKENQSTPKETAIEDKSVLPPLVEDQGQSPDIVQLTPKEIAIEDKPVLSPLVEDPGQSSDVVQSTPKEIAIEDTSILPLVVDDLGQSSDVVRSTPKEIAIEDKPVPPPLVEDSRQSSDAVSETSCPATPNTDSDQKVMHATPVPETEQPNLTFGANDEQGPAATTNNASKTVAQPPPKLDLHKAVPPAIGTHIPSPTGTEVSEGGDDWHSAPSTPAFLQSPALAQS